MITIKDQKIIYCYDGEKTIVEAWGENSLRVRSTKLAEMPQEDWALTEEASHQAQTEKIPGGALIKNGRITARISELDGKLSFYHRDGRLLLDEFVRNRKDVNASYCSALMIDAREFKPIVGGDFRLTARFESLDENERIFGMGQYQQENLNLKGCELELAQRNSQASVPFMVSSLGYGFLWNNPAVGRVTFGKNQTTWVAESAKKLDYWVTAGDTPAQIEEAYASVTGTVPMMPDFAMGFWQSKTRYRNPGEVLEVAREYKRRGLPIDVIVICAFHWPYHGDWRFDPKYWPEEQVDAMIAELREMGILLMTSVWTQVDLRSENYEEMKELGYLTRVEYGYPIAYDCMGYAMHFDATNPDACRYVWGKIKKGYYDRGVRVFWMDEAEPEYSVYDFGNYRYHLGPALQVGNVYPVKYAQAFYEGMTAEGQKNIVNILRCAWAGSQKYGALVWSGDIASSFHSLRCQLSAGLNMGMAGIPWWTTDIAGFHGGAIADEHFRELAIRWFQFGAFCPAMRLHGHREPLQDFSGDTGGGLFRSGAPNEIWSFGEKAYEVMRKFLFLRRNMKPYLTKIMREAHEKGTPVMRPVFYDFPQDPNAWQVEDAYFFGPDMLVAPILEEGARSRKVYLPEGRWVCPWTGTVYTGGQTVEAPAPIEVIPVFTRNGADQYFQKLDEGGGE